MNELRDKINPFFMYGTAWKEEKTKALTLMALENGFRAVDTANQRKHYFEEGVGLALNEFLDTKDYQRDDLFIQTKFTYKEGQDHRLPYDADADYPTQVKQSLNSSLDHLKTEYLDSYILHGPSTSRGLNDQDYEVWETMESLQKEGLIKHIGVSNINSHQLQLLLENAGINPSFVQNRCFAQQRWDKEIRNICNKNGIIYQGFSLLTANRRFLSDEKIKNIAKKYQIPIPGVIFCFATQVGMLPLTGTTSGKHMNEDLSALDNELTGDEIQVIENIAF